MVEELYSPGYIYYLLYKIIIFIMNFFINYLNYKKLYKKNLFILYSYIFRRNNLFERTNRN